MEVGAFFAGDPRPGSAGHRFTTDVEREALMASPSREGNPRLITLSTARKHSTPRQGATKWAHSGELTTMASYDVEMTMREFYESEGYDPDSLMNPRDVSPSDLDDESRVIAYTVVSNPDPDGPATTRDIEEYEVHAVIPADELGDYTDGAITYRGETPVTHAVHWAYRGGGVPKVVSIGYGDEMYGEESEFDDPHGWDRTVGQVNSLSDDFIRFDC